MWSRRVNKQNGVAVFVAVCLTWAIIGCSGDFVRRQGRQLSADGSPFYFAGFNAYWLNDWAKHGDPYSLNVVDTLFNKAKDLNLRVGRTWAFHWDLPSAPGVYDENEFKGLDYIVASAGRHGLRLILVLGNFWHAYMGPEKFNGWAGAGGDILEFYTNPAVKQLYKQHLQAIVTRVNTYTGTAYKDDPAIMSWNVLNEPRCPGCLDSGTQGIHRSWMNEMAGFVKGIDPNHLVVFGTEGYYMNSNDIPNNPGAASSCEGEDWLTELSSVSVDYANMHVYARQLEDVPTGPATWPVWLKCDFTCFVNWAVPYIKLHTQQAASQGIPLVLEEFGATLTFENFTEPERVTWFAIVYDLVKQSKDSGGPLMGALFWNAELFVITDASGYNIPLDGPRGSSTTNPTAYGRRMLGQPRITFAPALPAGHTAPPPTFLATARQLLQLDMQLDSFRRGPLRDQCAEQQARSGWSPPWYGKTDADIAQYQAQVQGKPILDVIAQGAAALQ